MAAPRVQVPDSGLGSTGNPILDSANAVSDSTFDPVTLEGNRPAQPSPLKSSTTAADLETAPAAPSSTGLPAGVARQQDISSTSSSTAAGTETKGGDSVESVLSAIGGAVVTAPLAALEAISHKVPDVVETVKAHAPHLPQSTSTTSGTSTSRSLPSSDELSHKVTQSGESVLHSAQSLATQAATYAQQGVHQLIEKLPESVASKLPTQVTSIGAEGGKQGSEMPHAATGKEAFDFTAPHTTGNFEASGSLQSSKNPAIVEAQSDLAVKAESGDL